MKILMISSYLPYPLFSGGQVRLYNLIKELSEKHEITLICEKRPFQTEKDIAHVKKICKNVITVERKKQWSLQNMLKTVFSSHSFLVIGHTQKDFTKKIQEVIERDTFDLIHIETFYVMQNLPAIQIPVVLVEHNIEYQVYERFMNKASLVLKPFLKKDIAKMRKEEEYFWREANVLVAVSREDQEVMRKIGVNPYLVSNGVNIDEFLFKEKHFNESSIKKILFIGDFKWIQNQDAAEFIIKEIWPKLKLKLTMQNVKLWIVGRKIPESIRSLTNDKDVLFDEKSSALPTPQIFQEAILLLAPIRIGGGTSYKILESMSSGTPVITMQMSADALSTKDGVDLLVGETAEELATKSIILLTNKKLYKSIATNGRKLVEEKYTWKKIAGDLDHVYQEVMLK